jgi:alpha-beta hydrolase superfamily lysophospholipase
MTGPVWLYLHGFGSGPRSYKGRAFVGWAASRGVEMQALDLRVPCMEKLRFSAMKSRVCDAIEAAGGARARAVLVGSSLGGLCACRVAEEEPRVSAVFAMAPAFRLAERWRARLGEQAWERWRIEGSLSVEDHATGGTAQVGFGFVEELEILDHGLPDVRVPVRIVHGARDDVVDVELSRTFAQGKPHVRVVEVDDGHDLVASLPRIIAEAESFFAPYGL